MVRQSPAHVLHNDENTESETQRLVWIIRECEAYKREGEREGKTAVSGNSEI